MKRPLISLTEHSVEDASATFPALFLEYPAQRCWYVAVDTLKKRNHQYYILIECPPEPGDEDCYYPYVLDEGSKQTVLGETMSFGRSLDKILGSDEEK